MTDGWQNLMNQMRREQRSKDLVESLLGLVTTAGIALVQAWLVMLVAPPFFAPNPGLWACYAAVLVIWLFFFVFLGIFKQ